MKNIVIARFSTSRSLLLSVIVLGATAGIFFPLLGSEGLVDYINSGVWTWLWPFAALSAIFLSSIILLLILKVTFFNGEAVYVGDRGDLIFMFPFIFRVPIDSIRKVEFLSRASMFREGGFVRVYKDDGTFKSIKTDLLVPSGEDLVEAIKNAVGVR
jgi:hypothetical protein